MTEPNPRANDPVIVADGFEVPRRFKHGPFVLEPLGPEHNEADYAAWTGSVEHIAATSRMKGWPDPELTLDQNLRDLRWHREDLDAGRGFTFTVLIDGVVNGCVYIYPQKDDAARIRVASWVTAEHKALDGPLVEAVWNWLWTDWPFESISYRDLDRTVAAKSPLLALRKPDATDLRWMADMAADAEAMGEHNWAGKDRDADKIYKQLRIDLLAGEMDDVYNGTLVVDLHDGTSIGTVSWRPEQWGPSDESRCVAFGIALLPDHRGKGLGTDAQRLLIDYLFRTRNFYRIQSDTAVDNPAERAALHKAGMIEEGLIQGAEYRNGEYHDHWVFGITRPQWEST